MNKDFGTIIYCLKPFLEDIAKHHELFSHLQFSHLYGVTFVMCVIQFKINWTEITMYQISLFGRNISLSPVKYLILSKIENILFFTVASAAAINLASIIFFYFSYAKLNIGYFFCFSSMHAYFIIN